MPAAERVKLEAQLASKEQQLLEQRTSYDAQIAAINKTLNAEISELKEQLRDKHEDCKRLSNLQDQQVKAKLALEKQLLDQKTSYDAQIAAIDKTFNVEVSSLKEQLRESNEGNEKISNLHDQQLKVNSELQSQLKEEREKASRAIFDLNQQIIAKDKAIEELQQKCTKIDNERAKHFVGQLQPLKDYLAENAYPLSPPTPYKTFEHVDSGAEVEGVFSTSYTSWDKTHQIIVKIDRPGRNVEREYKNLLAIGKSKYFIKAIALVSGVGGSKLLLLESCGHDLRCYLGGKHFSEYGNMKKVAECVNALHNLNFCHNDIKPEVCAIL